MLFGLSPTGVRVLSFAASGLMVGQTGLLCWQLGGRINAQILAMTAILAAPALLATQNYLSMNAWEPCFWMGAMLVMLRLANGTASPRAWLLFGLIAGLWNRKQALYCFLPGRSVYWNPYQSATGYLVVKVQRRWSCTNLFAGVTQLYLAVVSSVPYLPDAEHRRTFGQNHQAAANLVSGGADGHHAWSTSPLWMGGLVWFGFGRKGRTCALPSSTYLVFLLMMMALHAKNYYLAPIYPVLFARREQWHLESLRGTPGPPLPIRLFWRSRYCSSLVRSPSQFCRPTNTWNTQGFSWMPMPIARSTRAHCRQCFLTDLDGRRWCRDLPPAMMHCRPTCAPRLEYSATTTAKPAR